MKNYSKLLETKISSKEKLNLYFDNKDNSEQVNALILITLLRIHPASSESSAPCILLRTLS